MAGARPVFVDVDPQTLIIAPRCIEAAITPRTRAILPVHLYGQAADMVAIARIAARHNLAIVEDCCQAHLATAGGRPVGTIGAAGAFSFYPTKNLGALGDGGAITTEDDEVAEVARRLRFHGSTDKVTYTEVGYNSRLDELQAAVLRELLPDLDGWNDARRAAAHAYATRGLGDVPGMNLPHFDDPLEHVFHLYVVRHPDADALAQKLDAAGVASRGYYRRPVHLQPAMEQYGGDTLDLPGTAEAARTHLALPMGTQLSESQVDEVIAACASGST
jgi:dTDP-4-amino-4,6-dideoxygalactose transaminase